ncbi:MAG: S41 family peptidase [Planctomycetaceae bacterium]|nr:S41 family peptidase [Planctomycetaceae bacterium]
MPLRNILTILIAAVVSLVCYQKATHNRFGFIVSHAMGIIENNYIEEVEPRTLFENAMQGMVSELDEYSDYIGPEHFQQFQQIIDQEFVGIGVVVEGPPEKDELRVVNPVFDSPAYRAGMRAGDVILEIDGVSTKSMDINAAVKRMKGLPGTTVTLLVRHAGQDVQPQRMSIERELIRTKSVLGDRLCEDGRWTYYLESEPGIGYVRITSFGEYTAHELGEVLQFQDHPVEALILDLRGNVGGLLKAAIETSDMFIDGGVIVSMRGRTPGDEIVYTAKPEDTIVDPSIPVIVLVDRYSASASEIVAACLQDHGRALVAGQRSWGKGTVQNVIKLEHGTSALKLTTAGYWRPSGHNIHRGKDAHDEDEWGVRPSPGLEVVLTDEQYGALYEQRSARDVLSEEGGAQTPAADAPPSVPDLQLQRAVDYLKEKLVPAT